VGNCNGWFGIDYVTGNEYIEEEIIDEFGNKTIVRKKVNIVVLIFSY